MNPHTYDDLAKLYVRRAKGREYKVLGNGWELHNDVTTGQFTIGARYYTWERGANGNYVRKQTDFEPYLTINQDSVVTVVKRDLKNDNAFHNMLRKYFMLRVCSMTSKYGSYEHPVRMGVYKFPSNGNDYPFHTGLQFKVTLNRRIVIVSVKQDVVRKTDRAAAKPVYEYANKVLGVMDVLHRLGSFEGDKKLSWDERRRALSNVEVFDMSEEAMALFAEAAYREADVVTQNVRSSYWDPKTQLRIDIPAAEVKATYYANLRKNAKRKLHALLKARHGGFYTEPV
jgi:hypothetical protein